jgi:membrane-bound serine protease (ClpP class)
VMALVAMVFCTNEACCQEDLPPSRVSIVSLDGQLIHPVTERFLIRAVQRAAGRGDQCVILQLDTPGGLLESTRNIVKEILASEIPVVVYIAPSGARAGSAAVFIPLSAHLTAMAPGTTIGGQPVAQNLPAPNDDPLKNAKNPEQQNPNDPAAWARDLAERRGRNEDWAIRAVRDGLATSAEEAQQKYVIDFLAADQNDLLNKLDGRKVTVPGGVVVLQTKGAVVERLEMSWPERLLCLLASPTLAYLLILLGFFGLTFEIIHPGSWAPGILGVLCLVLAVIAMQMLPINYAGLALIVLGLFLVVLEVKFHSYGILTTAGIMGLLLGSALLVEPVGGNERVSWMVVAPVSIALALIVLLLVGNVVRVHSTRVKTGVENLIGAVARVRGDLVGQGYVYVAGELWRARCDQVLQDGETVRILRCEGLTLFVKPAIDLASERVHP